MYIVEVPQKRPGNCFCCGSPGRDGRKMLDTLRTFARHGTAYICETCIKNMAKMFGLGELEPLIMERDLQWSKNQDLEAQNANLRSALNALGVVIPERTVILDPVEISKQKSRPSDDGLKNTEQRSENPVDESDESDSGRGFADMGELERADAVLNELGSRSSPFADGV